MTIAEQFIILKIINKCVGLVPIHLKVKNKNFLRIFSKRVPVLISLLSVCIATYLLYHPIFESSGTIHGIINFASLLSVWLTIISGNGQCFFFPSTYQNINDQIKRIDKLYKNKFSPEYTVNLSRQYIRKVRLIFTLFFISQSILFYEVRVVTGNGMLSSFLTSTLRSIFPIEVVHIVLYTDIITMFIRELCLSMVNSSMLFFPSSKFELLKNVKIMHMELWKLVVDVNRYFGWNLLCLLLKLFVYITLLLYWTFVAINNEVDVLGLIEASVSLFYGIVCLFILTNSCQSCSIEVTKLTEHIEQFAFLSTDNMQLYHLKREIFNQIRHHPMYISAGNFFRIDRRLVTNIFAGCCMYNTIFIQFFLAVERKLEQRPKNDTFLD